MKIWLQWMVAMQISATEHQFGHIAARYLVGPPQPPMLSPVSDTTVHVFSKDPQAFRVYAWELARQLQTPVTIDHQRTLPYWMTLYTEQEQKSFFQSAKADRSQVADHHWRQLERIREWDPSSWHDWKSSVTSSEAKTRGIFGLNQTWLSGHILERVFDGGPLLWRCSSHLSPTPCLSQPLDHHAIAIKSIWHPHHRPLPVYRTDPISLRDRISTTASWSTPDTTIERLHDERFFSIELHDGSQYHLVGLHISVKLQPHWMWITLWWSDTPHSDFGEDRPLDFAEPWQNYKMCGIVGGASSNDQWCSNPYIEKGEGNADTHCAACHQHAGTQLTQMEILANPLHRKQTVRSVFPTDYLWILGSTTRRALRSLALE